MGVMPISPQICQREYQRSSCEGVCRFGRPEHHHVGGLCQEVQRGPPHRPPLLGHRARRRHAEDRRPHPVGADADRHGVRGYQLLRSRGPTDGHSARTRHAAPASGSNSFQLLYTVVE